MKASRSVAVEKRLKKLRKRFASMLHEKDLDKDFAEITADDNAHIADRTFFAGEIFWVEREGWQGCGGFHTNASRDHHPGLVVRKQGQPHQPVAMVPGSTKQYRYLKNGRPAACFHPEKNIAWKISNRDHPSEQYYVLDYRRPVARSHIGFPLGRLQHSDTIRLQRAVQRIEQQS